jgi:RimJ/RimL family protein N-acetyltransferase
VNHYPYAKWYLMMDVNGAPVGSIYLTKTREVGVAVKNGHQRKGHARAAISQLRTIHPGPMYANVAPNNGPSHSLFKKLGGKVIQYTYEL